MQTTYKSAAFLLCNENRSSFVYHVYCNRGGWIESRESLRIIPISPQHQEELCMRIGGQNESEQKVYRLTPEGYAKNKDLLEYLSTDKRKESADYIHDANVTADSSEII